MLITAAMSLLALQGPSQSWDGIEGRTRVSVPAAAAQAVVDGKLNEPVWRTAARLTGFSQYQPVDGRPAEDPTEVLVWYAPDAIWFGIRARELHGDVVRATRANRDNIASEDYIQILLDTYNDHRNAFVFGVNALGVQQDGTRSDQFNGGAGGRSATGSGLREVNPQDGSVDLNPDYVFESHGQLVDGGYEVEIRIPFKTLRYQDAKEQTWGLHVLRRVQHSGFQTSWIAAKRANASFLVQEGKLEGLRDLQRGLVLEATPTATARLDGAPSPSWKYDRDAQLGGDLRWGIRQNLTLNGTINPDFSQVEADVGQVTLNERFALFYPEKRPFFLDGLELFDSPNQLIYTRRIVSPDAGIKLSGKLASTNVATMVAVDGEHLSLSGGHRPVFGITRLRRDFGSNSTLGVVGTTREDGADFSRLAGADMRLYHNKLYYVQLQAVQSWTDTAGRAMRGPMFEAVWDRTGRAAGFHYSIQSTAPSFRAAAGFVNRTGVTEIGVRNRLTYYGAQGALIQTATAFGGFDRITPYNHPAGSALEGSESVSPSATLRGGWRLSSSVSRSFFNYDRAQYTRYTVGPANNPAPFIVPTGERNLFSGSLGVTTPTYRLFTATTTLARGEVPIFREAAPGTSTRIDATVDLRPTAGLRTSFQYSRLAIDRQRDGSSFSVEAIPRVKVEYQISRAIFARVVGQYAARKRAPLLTRDGEPILVGGTVDAGERTNELRADWLFSYRPTPGTLFHIGYGTTMNEPDQFRFSDLTRTTDGFFAKLSYLIRM